LRTVVEPGYGRSRARPPKMRIAESSRRREASAHHRRTEPRCSA
jgi:hypothetical protein